MKSKDLERHRFLIALIPQKEIVDNLEKIRKIAKIKNKRSAPHITIVDNSFEDIKKVDKELKKIAKSSKPFNVKIEGLDTFIVKKSSGIERYKQNNSLIYRIKNDSQLNNLRKKILCRLDYLKTSDRLEQWIKENPKISQRSLKNIKKYGTPFGLKEWKFHTTIGLIPKDKTKEILEKIKELKIPYQTLYSWISSSNPISILKAYELLKFWKETCEKTEEEFNNRWNLIYENNEGFSQNGQRKIVLPKEFNTDLAYIVGFFQGDGHLKKENKKGFQEYSIYFYEGNLEVLNKINELIKKEFNVKGNIYLGSNKKEHKWHILRVSSKLIYNFFKNVLNLKMGKKVREVGVPEIIKKAELPMQLSFIKGFFDSEGGVGETLKNPWLDIGQASKDSPCEILLWIKDKLSENGIILSEAKRTKNQEFFRIRTAKRETIKRFFNTISSEHPEKINKFEKIIEKCQNKNK